MNDILAKLFVAADNHGEDEAPDHTVGDLQALLTKAWDLLLPSQRVELLESDEADCVVQAGARGEFEASDLVAEIHQTVANMETVLTAAGYSFGDGYWAFRGEESNFFPDHIDAVVDAFQDYQPTKI